MFGRDSRGRPRAARFTEGEAALTRAADRADRYLVPVDTDALAELGARLPAGRLLADGQARLPRIAAALHRALLAATGLPDMPRPTKPGDPPAKAAAKPATTASSPGGRSGAGAGAMGPGGPGKAAGGGSGGGGGGDGSGERKPLADWAELRPGDLVLAEDTDEGGHYLARILATKADDDVVLAWEGFPDLPEFARPRRTLGLVHPEAVAQVLTP